MYRQKSGDCSSEDVKIWRRHVSLPNTIGEASGSCSSSHIQDAFLCFSPQISHWMPFLVLERTELIIVLINYREWAWLGPRGYSIPPLIIAGGRGKGLSSEYKGILSSWVNVVEGAVWCCVLSWASHVNLFSLVPSAITIAAVIVCFLFSLLFPKHCPYLNSWSLPYGPPSLLSSFPQQEGQRESRELQSSTWVGESQWGHRTGECHS